MIEITTPLKAKLADLVVLSQKNRQPDENPGAKLSIECNLPLEVLAMFAGGMRSSWYEPGPSSQGALEGMQVERLTSLGEFIGWSTWSKEYTGHTVTIDFGIGGPSNIVIKDAKLHHFKFSPQDGSVFAKFKVESEDVSEAMFGRLAKLKSCEVSLLIDPPQLDSQRDFDDDAGNPFGTHGKDSDSTPPPQSSTHEKPAKGKAKADPGRAATDAFVGAAT